MNNGHILSLKKVKTFQKFYIKYNILILENVFQIN